MTTLTITAKGQVTLKQELLKHLGVGPGERVEADELRDGRILVRAAVQDGSISDFIRQPVTTQWTEADDR